LAAWPRYDLKRQLENLRCERESLAGKIRGRLKIGKFDLSRLPERDRVAVARRYVELDEQLSDLVRHIKDLEVAANFAKQWATRI
jgi:hypothetical protein